MKRYLIFSLFVSTVLVSSSCYASDQENDSPKLQFSFSLGRDYKLTPSLKT